MCGGGAQDAEVTFCGWSMPALGGSDPVNSLEEARVECALDCAQSECNASLNIISDENFPRFPMGQC